MSANGWGKLLKWSLSQSDTGNTGNAGGGEGGGSAICDTGDVAVGEVPPVVPARSEEERAWLASALQSMSVDEAARMRELGKVLQSYQDVPASSSAAEVAAAEAALAALKLAALEELQDLVEGIDNAKDLFMVGAVGPLLDAVRGAASAASSSAAAGAPAEGCQRLLGCADLAVRAQACQVVATTVQNNPAAQAWALSTDTLPALLHTLASCTAAAAAAAAAPAPAPAPAALGHLLASAMGATSALLRDCMPAQTALLVTGAPAGSSPLAAGLATLTDCLALLPPPSPPAGAAPLKLQRRCTSLLRHLLGSCHPEHALTGLVSAPGALPALLALLALHPQPDQPEAGDTRASALACLLACCLPASGEAVVFDAQDSRAPRGLYDGAKAASAGGGKGGAAGAAAGAAASMTDGPAAAAAAAAEPVLLLGNASSGSGVTASGSSGSRGALSPRPATTPLPAGPQPLLTLEARRAALVASGVLPAVQAHHAWCKGLLGVVAGGGGGGSSEAEEGGEAEGYALEAQQCLDILAALGGNV